MKRVGDPEPWISRAQTEVEAAKCQFRQLPLWLLHQFQWTVDIWYVNHTTKCLHQKRVHMMDDRQSVFMSFFFRFRESLRISECLFACLRARTCGAFSNEI